jgi:predicted lipoprotein with Yx(FWY)xxD motif
MRKAVPALAVIVAASALIAVGPASAHRAHASTTRATLQLRNGKLGRVIVDGRGLTLYLFEKDKGGKSACYSACAKVWKPLLTSSKARAGTGVRSSLIGSTRRKDGTLQVTYGGHPLYHYDDDHKPGQTAGEGLRAFGAGWYVLAPSGKKIDKS